MSWRKRVFLTVLCFGVLLSAAGITRIMLPTREVLSLYGIGLLVFPAGRYITLLPIIHPGLGFSPLFLSGLAVLVESCIALFVTVNLDLLFKLPWLGHGLRGMEKNGRETLSQRPWVRRMAFLGVIVFVSIPVPGTGGVGGTVAAHLVGLGAVRSFMAVIIGTVIGAYGMAMGAATLAKTFFPMRDSAWFGILRFLIIVSIIFTLSWLGRRGVDTQEQSGTDNLSMIA